MSSPRISSFFAGLIVKWASFRKTFSSSCMQDERKFMRNPMWFSIGKKPNGIPDKIAFFRPRAEKSDFSGMTNLTIRILMPLFLLALVSCGDNEIKLPKVFGGSEVPSEVLDEPRVVPVPSPQNQATWPRLGDVPSMTKDFTPQPTIDAARREMQSDRSDAERLQRDYDAAPPALPPPPAPQE
jgi:hypothetical protein